MQMIAWGWKGVDRGQDYWAGKLGTTTSGTAITDMVRVTNGNTGWDLPSHAGKYVVLDVGDFTFQQWLLLNMRHVVDYQAPLIYHPILLKRFYPYLDDDASGHYQVGRGYLERDGQAHRGQLLRALEPAGLRPVRALHQAGAVAQRLSAATRPTSPTRSTTSERERAHLADRRAARRTRPHRVHGRRVVRPAHTHRAVDGPASPSDTASTPTETASATDGPLVPDTDLLDWQPVEGSVDDTVTRNTTTTVTLAADNKTAVIDGSQQLTVEAGRRGTISHVLLDEQRAVVVIEDSLAERGDQATIVDLASGGTAVVDQSSAPPTTTGGTWAMGAETLVHATVANDTSYCLATVSLESGQGSPGWCAEPHHGFRGAVITETGLSVMSFDDQRPTSCATLLAIDGTEATPFEDVTDCQGWDAALLDDGAIWSEVPKPNRQEAAVFRARLGDETLRPRPRPDREPGVVRRGGVLRARPGDQDRPRAPDALHCRRHAVGGLRVGLAGHRVPHRAALRRRRDHPDQLRRPGQRAGVRRPVLTTLTR